MFARASGISGTTVLTNAVNLGKGAALRHGMNHILVRHPDCIGVVTADADGQHAVTDILRIASELQERSAELIFGCRDFKQEIPFRSKIGNLTGFFTTSGRFDCLNSSRRSRGWARSNPRVSCGRWC